MWRQVAGLPRVIKWPLLRVFWMKRQYFYLWLYNLRQAAKRSFNWITGRIMTTSFVITGIVYNKSIWPRNAEKCSRGGCLRTPPPSPKGDSLRPSVSQILYPPLQPAHYVLLFVFSHAFAASVQRQWPQVEPVRLHGPDGVTGSQQWYQHWLRRQTALPRTGENYPLLPQFPVLAGSVQRVHQGNSFIGPWNRLQVDQPADHEWAPPSTCEESSNLVLSWSYTNYASYMWCFTYYLVSYVHGFVIQCVKKFLRLAMYLIYR